MTEDLPRKHPGLEIEAPLDGFCVVRHSTTGKYFRLGAREATFLGNLDGSRSLQQVRLDSDPFNAEQVDRLVAWFGQRGMLDAASPEPIPEPVHFSRRIVGWIVHSDQIRIRLVNPDRFLDSQRALIGAFVSRPALALYLMIFIAPAAFYIFWPERVLRSASTYELPHTFWQFLVLYLMFFCMIACHELAHAVTCKHFGGRVEKIGLMFFFLSPVIYCDVSDSWRLREPWQRSLIAAAGIFFQLVLASVALVFWMITGTTLLATFAIMSIAVGLLNFFPFVKMDGYWILVHTLGEPNLRKKGFDAVDRLARRALGRPTRTSDDERAIVVYGLVAMLAVPAFWILGLSGIYQLGNKLSPTIGFVMTCLMGLVLAYRAVRWTKAYVRSLGSDPVLAKS